MTPGDVRRIYAAVESELINCVGDYVDIKPFVLEAVETLRSRDIRIGSTTGYTAG
jgi:phosphonoacetaldehyde hydrolase